MPFIFLIKKYFIFFFGLLFVDVYNAKNKLYFSNSSEKKRFPVI